MSLREELPRVIAADPRFAIDGYAFVLESLNHARTQKLKKQGRKADKPPSSRSSRGTGASSSKSRRPAVSGHVTGPELCESVRKLALSQFGLLAAAVLNHWGIHSTSDIGDIVY